MSEIEVERSMKTMAALNLDSTKVFYFIKCEMSFFFPIFPFRRPCSAELVCSV